MSDSIGNPQNSIPSSSQFIMKGSVRNGVNALLDELSSVSRQCARGSKAAEADYHRTAAKLMIARPAFSEEDEKRQIRNSGRLYHLAALIESGRIPLGMKLKHPNI
jgi:hypothetical protein